MYILYVYFKNFLRHFLYVRQPKFLAGSIACVLHAEDFYALNPVVTKSHSLWFARGVVMSELECGKEYQLPV